MNNQILESIFLLIFHYITKHQKIIYFLGIYLKKTIFQQRNRGLDLYKKNLAERGKLKTRWSKIYKITGGISVF
jgi:hypothetical protein